MNHFKTQRLSQLSKIKKNKRVKTGRKYLYFNVRVLHLFKVTVWKIVWFIFLPMEFYSCQPSEMKKYMIQYSLLEQRRAHLR